MFVFQPCLLETGEGQPHAGIWLKAGHFQAQLLRLMSDIWLVQTSTVHSATGRSTWRQGRYTWDMVLNS
jgi:hypothetical protein